jgi:uncharacterized protein (DUF983 family)
LDSLTSVRIRVSEAVQKFEAATADWPVWRRLVVFVPIFIVLSMLLVFAILGGLSALHLGAGR